jgi:hypothetical protein
VRSRLVIRSADPNVGAGRRHIAGPSLDHPEMVTPTLHYWDAERLPWVHFADDLPRYPEFPPVA